MFLSQFGFRPEVPKVFVDLFAIEKKSELIRYCKNATVTDHEFSELVVNCGTIGYAHTPKWNEFVPEHLALTETDINAFRSTGTPVEKARLGKVMSKVRATFRERRYIAAHFFVSSPDKWHLIYFDFRDTDEENDNHWFGGTHFHLVNHLWPEHAPDALWSQFDQRRQCICGNIHVAFTQTSPENWKHRKKANKTNGE